MTTRAPAFTPLGALAIASIAFATFLVGASVAFSAGAPPLVTILGGHIALVAVPAIACLRSRRSFAALGFVRPRARMLAAAALIGVSAWYVNLWIVSLLPDFDVRALERIVGQPPLAVVLVALAVVPAISEEILFRGVVLRALATRFFPPVAIALSAALFAAYHLSLVQLVPTFTLGLALGLVVWRGDSVIPAMLAHFLNNACAILVAREAIPGAAWLDHYPVASLAVAATLTTSGVVLALRAQSPTPARM